MRRADLLRRFVGDVERLQDLYLRALTPPVIALLTSLVAVLVAALAQAGGASGAAARSGAAPLQPQPALGASP